MRNCHRARYAELVSHKDAAPAAAGARIAPLPPGPKVNAELESSDIERLSKGCRRWVRLTVEEFAALVTNTLVTGTFGETLFSYNNTQVINLI